jgi:DNA-binding transcriptional LysR family regulator
MELRHLRYFIAVAEELHFGRAAKRLHMAQPPLSQQIRALELELGVTLLARTQRSVRLTEPGRLFLAEARRTVAQAEHAMMVARRAGRGEGGRLRVGFLSTAMYGRLPAIIRAFTAEHPHVVLELHELTTLAQGDALQAGTVDAAFLRLDDAGLAAHRAKGLALEAAWREPYVVAVPAGHPLAAAASIRAGDLRDAGFVLFPRSASPPVHDHITQLCRQAGFEPRIVQEAAVMPTLLAYVAAGIGVTIAPASLAGLALEGVAFRPLAEPGFDTQMAIVWRPEDGSPVLAAFVAAVRAARGDCGDGVSER